MRWDLARSSLGDSPKESESSLGTRREIAGKKIGGLAARLSEVARICGTHCCSRTNHHAAAYRSSRPYFYLYYHPLPQLRDPFRSNRNKCHYTHG
ncbi:hypothetical protein BHE74_00053601 [Ensete ventricosum]|nr:hypothetical protein BHE74_00053601 [Ensete ventricosum]